MLELRRNRDRGYADLGGLKSYYTFSFADYYDPEHVDFGPLQIFNEDRIKPGKGYPTGQHRDLEVLMYVIDGELRHRDSLGNEVGLRAGGLQRITAGTGISHTELNASASQDVHLLFVGIKPASSGLPPSYEHKVFADDEKRGVLRLLAAPDGAGGSLTIQQDARLYGGIFHEAQRVELDLPGSRRAYLHVVRGSIAVNETRLNAGDGVKINTPDGVVLQHGRHADILLLDLPADSPAPKRKATPKT